MAALDKKLLRDLWEMRSQAVAIGSVMAAGVVMFVTYLSNFDSLQRTVDTYYERQRFADVFAMLKRAPSSLEADLRAIPGVSIVDTRVVADVTLDVPGLLEPATGRLISVPSRGRPALNDVFLRAGRWPEAGRPDEVLASEVFTEANQMSPGDPITAIINGRRRRLTIVGVALSPEYVFSIRPGEMIPDNRRFALLWMERRALAAAFDMEGGFNDVSLRVMPGFPVEEVIADLDRLVEPFGGLGAVPRRLQQSAWTLDNELVQLSTFGFIIPAIFLAVAAFVLNVALARALALQRPQLAALKALGYSNRELGWHYFKWALIIASLGALAGVAVGAWLGAQMIQLYNQYFRFPSLDYRLSAAVALGAMALAFVSAAIGAISAVRRAVRVPPAEAMRPESPARYRASIIETPRIQRALGQGARMVLRNLERQPLRALASVVGIAFGGAILLIGFGFIDAMEVLIARQFNDGMRQDVTVTFVEPRSSAALHGMASMPGVMSVEPMRVVPARLRVGARSRTLALTGLNPDPDLNRVVDQQGRPRPLPPEGLVLSRMLGVVLGAGPGDMVQVEVLEGRRPVRQVRVAGVIDDIMGLQAYMDIAALGRLMREGRTVSGAYLQVDPAALEPLYARLKLTPVVAGVAIREAALRNFRDVMAQNMNLTIGINVVFAAIIAVGVVYNAARISLSERERELASLRVLGFTRGEISSILLGELAILTLLSLPCGTLIGYGLGLFIMTIFQNEVYRIPFIVTPATMAWGWLTIIAAAALSALAVRRRLDRLDLVAVLKSRE
ncbi:MAG: ABC transporter permease [Acidobacteria bacterium RIFCSPLOWO2_12_FULL_67_14b]|nr:MAG: ABC transporter permease [Acidobacteria bacterium RIFCSPLOWO2_12_FULL_67_14b]